MLKRSFQHPDELDPVAQLVGDQEQTSPRQRVATVGYLMLKRFLDILVSLALLALLLPLMVLISVVIRLSSPGPAIYCQKRLTDNGKIFTIFKFRTMSTDAETESGAVWADAADPRVTTIGRLLRHTRLDELPQLLNVLVGDMSLVGPRPERPELARELVRLLPDFERRTQVKAGLTGLAQIARGYASSLDDHREKLALDLAYIRGRSLWLDLQILVRTVLIVVTGRGAR
ncbi:MAG: sugar transferase [Bdellovibrionales bacterium]|nr:sugar transferase [Bdellovibrionales bacterium]